MEAAHIPWRPLGRLLVEQGLLTDEELEFALAKQKTTGRRLGETIVECGFVSSPDLSNALAAQYGIELIAETGFGTGLRAQIQRRHESDRGRPTLASVPDSEEPSEETLPEFVEPEAPRPSDAIVLAQLEEQWAKLAAAEEWLAEREVELAVLAAERGRRRAQAERLTRLARGARMELSAERERNEELIGLNQAVDGQVDEQRAKLAAAEQRLAERERESEALTADRDRRRAQAVRFARRVRTRDDELARRTDELRGLGETADRLRDQAERLSDDVSGCDAEIDRLRNENTRRRAQAVRFAARSRELRCAGDEESDEAPVVTPSSHLVFLQHARGYELVERDGPPPPRHSPLEFPGLCDGTLVVAGSRPSPFPGDGRPCVVAQQR